jgi:hypothetical protein
MRQEEGVLAGVPEVEGGAIEDIGGGRRGGGRSGGGAVVAVGGDLSCV